MATFAKTVEEVRDEILQQFGADNSSDYQTLVLSMLNAAIEDIHMTFDWKHLRDIQTVMVDSNTPFINFSADVRRVLSLHQSGQDEFLTEKDVQSFHRQKENPAVTTPAYFAYVGMGQSTDANAPYYVIEVYTAPAEGAEYTLYYIKYFDELTSSDLSIVPALPPKIWRLAQEKARIEVMKFVEKPRSTIETMEKMFLLQLSAAQAEEQLGQSRLDSFRQEPAVSDHFSTRWGR